MAAGLGAAILAVTAMGAAAPASAASPTAATAVRHAPTTERTLVCTVNDNGVNFRGGPGSNYPVLGTVNRGQKLNYRGRTGDWIMGDLWGGTTGVWIYVAYLDC